MNVFLLINYLHLSHNNVIAFGFYSQAVQFVRDGTISFIMTHINYNYAHFNANRR